MYQMIVTEGPNRGHLFTLQPGENRLGRDPEVEIIVPDNRVSRLHAVINQQINGFVVTDAGSRNGIYLNGIRCEEALLCPGDELMVGGVKMLVLASVEEVEEALGLTLYSTIGLSLEGQEGSVALPTMPQTYLIGGSKPMQSVNRLIFRAAQSGTTTLITGESGTGKELVASAVHRNSPRRRMPFVPLNGAVLGGQLLDSELFGHEKGAFTDAVAMRKGAFELADGGTLFLDEVGELPPETQAALLRVIEWKGFRRVGGSEMILPDVRLVVATNRDLRRAVTEGSFREDLYYRLAVVHIELPPLRERGDDIVLLAEHFLEEFRKTMGSAASRFSAQALSALRSYRFPGNVRELRNLVERIVIFCDEEEIGVDDLPSEVTTEAGESVEGASVGVGAGGEFPPLQVMERAHIQRALERTEGNKSQAARLLGIDRMTLYARIKRHDIPI